MLEAEHIRKSYRGKKVLTDISFCAEPGECIAIAGGNGTGKTTLLSILAGVCRPDGGSVRFEGTEAVGKRRVFEHFAAYVPQENPLIPDLTAYDNYRLWFKGDRKRMEEELSSGVGKRLGLEQFLSVPAGKLSGGQKKRLSIASALSGRAPVLILDEPGAALDLAAREEILDWIREYREKGGLVILTSHEMEELRACSRLFLLKNGVLEAEDPGISAQELIARFTQS